MVHLIRLQGYGLSIWFSQPLYDNAYLIKMKFLLYEEQVWTIGNEAIYCVQVHDMKDQVHNLVVANTVACFIPQGIGAKVFNNIVNSFLCQNISLTVIFLYYCFSQ